MVHIKEGAQRLGTKWLAMEKARVRRAFSSAAFLAVMTPATASRATREPEVRRAWADPQCR